MTETPRAWVGCLACYNGGSLVGEWVDAIDAADLTTEDLHDGPTDHEELWVFDHEYLPISGECNPSVAAEWGDIMDTILRELTGIPIEVIAELIEDIGWGSPSNIDPREIIDQYQGEFDSDRDFFRQQADDVMNIPEELVYYFDYDQYQRDNEGDYRQVRHNGRVYIFSCY